MLASEPLEVLMGDVTFLGRINSLKELLEAYLTLVHQFEKGSLKL